MIQKNTLWRPLLILVFIFFTWNTLVMKPLKIFTVYLHELGHFTAAKLLGYKILEFQVSLNESGFVSYMAQDQSVFKNIVVGSAGYLGSLCFAVLILSSRKTRYRKPILLGFTAMFVLISLLYSGMSFTLFFAVIFAVFVLVLVKLNQPLLEELVLEFAGFASIIYAIQDTFVDTLVYYFMFGQAVRSDAVALQMATYIPAPIWGILWTSLSLVIVWITLKKEVSSL